MERPLGLHINKARIIRGNTQKDIRPAKVNVNVGLLFAKFLSCSQDDHIWSGSAIISDCIGLFCRYSRAMFESASVAQRIVSRANSWEVSYHVLSGRFLPTPASSTRRWAGLKATRLAKKCLQSAVSRRRSPYSLRPKTLVVVDRILRAEVERQCP